jgi:hypothetical protein
MSYYLLPKNMNSIQFQPIISKEQVKTSMSYSLEQSYTQTKTNVFDIIEEIEKEPLTEAMFQNVIELIHPYAFIFSKVPGSIYSVSKLKPNNHIFYDLFEITYNLNVIQSLNLKKIDTLHISPNYEGSVDCLELFREDHHDTYDCFKRISNEELKTNKKKYDYIFYETNFDEKEYIHSCVYALVVLLNNQKWNGHCIIKINGIFCKPILEVLYALCFFFNKVYISKPNSSNITTFERYIICKHFQLKEENNIYMNYNQDILMQCFNETNDNNQKENTCLNIHQLFCYELPCYFKNKIIEINNIIGKQQLDALNQIISIWKDKHRENKIEKIKKHNIHKSVLWCEKYKIPCNKFKEKTNIFLSVSQNKKEESEKNDNNTNQLCGYFIEKIVIDVLQDIIDDIAHDTN